MKSTANTQVQAGDVEAQTRRRSLLGWAMIVAGAASFLTGSLVLLVLIAAHFSSVPGVSDNPVGLVTVLIFCPLPLLIAGSILLIAGFLAIRRARGRDATDHLGQVVGLPTFKYHSDPIATGSIIPSDNVCQCCGQNRGFIYVGPVYGAEAMGLRDRLCLWCIADGSAHQKYGAEFTDAAVVGSRRRGWDEVPNEVMELVVIPIPIEHARQTSACEGR
jgi:hypothetical protein